MNILGDLLDRLEEEQTANRISAIRSATAYLFFTLVIRLFFLWMAGEI